MKNWLIMKYNALIDTRISEVRSQASTLENEAIPLQPNPLYGVRTTSGYEIVETPIKMKQNPVYATTTQSDATQVQSDVVYGVFNDEQTSQVENEGMEVTENQHYDYIQMN